MSWMPILYSLHTKYLTTLFKKRWYARISALVNGNLCCVEQRRAHNRFGQPSLGFEVHRHQCDLSFDFTPSFAGLRKAVSIVSPASTILADPATEQSNRGFVPFVRLKAGVDVFAWDQKLILPGWTSSPFVLKTLRTVSITCCLSLVLPMVVVSSAKPIQFKLYSTESPSGAQPRHRRALLLSSVPSIFS